MNKNGPIVMIEDDVDDCEMFKEVFKKLKFKNEILYFKNGEEALEFLTHTSVEPFIIFSDINMPVLNGLELREQIHNNEDLRLKCTPYLFFTTSAGQKHIVEAYSTSVQGFFVKPADFNHLLKTIKVIVEYWQECISPDYVKSGNILKRA